MNDLKLFIDEGADDLERTLLLSAKDDEVPDGAPERALTAIGVAAPLIAHGASGAAGGAAAAAGGAAIKGASAAGLVVVKWLGIGLLAGAVTGGALVAVSSRHAAADRSPATHVAFTFQKQSAPAQPAPLVPPPPETAESAAPAVEQAAPSASTQNAAPDVSQELALLDRARKALGAGDAHGALAALAEHARRFPHGELGLEAELLHVEALLASGDGEQAASRARAFLTAHPDSPYTARVRTLLEKATHKAPAPARQRAEPATASEPPPAETAPAPSVTGPPSSNVASFPSQ
jgi:TolA-binding protein